jgi:hypothetical protein
MCAFYNFFLFSCFIRGKCWVWGEKKKITAVWCVSSRNSSAWAPAGSYRVDSRKLVLVRDLKNQNVLYSSFSLSQSEVDLFFSFFFFLVGLGFEVRAIKFAKQMLYCSSHASSPFCSDYFGDGVLRTICLCWPWPLILLISTSQVARITGVNHWCLARLIFLFT